MLGGGGYAGIAWEVGVVLGLRDAGVDITTAHRVVGTSAGSVAGTAVTHEKLLRSVWDAQFEHVDAAAGAVFTRGMTARIVLPMALPGSPVRRRARLGALARKVSPAHTDDRVAFVRERLGGADWPTDADLRICAVNARTGAFRAFGRHSGVELAVAVAASCAVPLVWRPVPIGDDEYIDGGFRSVANADLAQGCDRVVVLAPLEPLVPHYLRITAQLARLGPDVRHIVIRPDRASRGAIGEDYLGVERRAAVAWAGRTQGRSVAATVASIWPS